ncbi:hypothetical protein NG726_03130 [Pseudomonas sp. MOB-449]|nr:hypothetical protein [Pseudomonas sp. MOB-449]
MNKAMQPLTAAALSFAVLAPAAWAGESNQAAAPKPPAGQSQQMDHGQMNHGQMDHGQMDHSQVKGMDHSQMKGMDHSQMQQMAPGKMDHGAMHKDAKPKTEGSDDR